MIPDPSLVARLRAAGCVFAEEEAALLVEAADSPASLEPLVARRLAGEPLETILGWASFAGLRVACAPGVFVPRRRTELMVRLAVARLRPDGPDEVTSATAAQRAAERGAERGAGLRPVHRHVLDLGCGTGAIGAAVAANAPGVDVWAVDVDPAAVDCARRNLPPERVLLGDLYEPLPPDLRFDLILANAPYVPTDAIALMPPEARDHEHRVALDGGRDGLDVQRRAIAGAAGRLAPGGAILVETSRRQAEPTAALMEDAGLLPSLHTDDEIGGTVVLGRG
ncbi:release factor glutamine methyltransferase [Nocardioides terrae]|uniref:Release factor glutamine methyltransferase n=1 Tax=Nocardioides terrae TaxID=574651 RepID=A0A1I1H5P7_9ACTN|nr:methyltransferase [Nocardioides terrae]SFC19327.1 release factor glutamine methyltransferase [Nocardioides terrae]